MWLQVYYGYCNITIVTMLLVIVFYGDDRQRSAHGQRNRINNFPRGQQALATAVTANLSRN